MVIILFTIQKFSSDSSRFIIEDIKEKEKNLEKDLRILGSCQIIAQMPLDVKEM